MPFFCCFKRTAPIQASNPEDYLMALQSNSRPLYHKTVCDMEMDETWAKIILRTDHKETFTKPLMMLRPGPSIDLVTFDTISNKGKIASCDLQLSVEDKTLYLNNMPAQDYLQEYTKTHESVFLTKATILKIEKAKLKAIKDLNRTNPQYATKLANDPYFDVMKMMRQTINSHTSFIEIGAKEEAEELLSHSETIGAYLTCVGHGETPSPVQRTLSKKKQEFQHYMVSYTTKDGIEHHPFCVDSDGNIIDKKRKGIYSHFAEKRADEQGKAFIPSLIENAVPIGLVRTLSQSSITYSAQKRPS